MSVVLTPILYQESCSALGIQRQVNLDPVLLGCLPWSRDLGQKGHLNTQALHQGPSFLLKRFKFQIQLEFLGGNMVCTFISLLFLETSFRYYQVHFKHIKEANQLTIEASAR